MNQEAKQKQDDTPRKSNSFSSRDALRAMSLIGEVSPFGNKDEEEPPKKEEKE